MTLETSPSIDPSERTLFDSRTLFLSGVVNSELALRITRQLLALEKASAEAPITLWINSPGGEVQAGFAIYDMIQFISPRVITVINGTAASMGSVIALAAERSDRYAMTNAKLLLHQPLIGGTIQGPASDIEIHARDIIQLKQRMHRLYAERTGTPEEVFVEMMERDRWIAPEEAVQLGLIKGILETKTRSALAALTGNQ